MIRTIDNGDGGFTVRVEGYSVDLVGECAGAASEIITAEYKKEGAEKAIITFANIVEQTLQYVEQDTGIDIMKELREANRQMHRDPFTMGMSGDAFAKFMDDINLGGSK